MSVNAVQGGLDSKGGKVERKEEAKEGGEKGRERGSCNRTTFVLLEGRRRKGRGVRRWTGERRDGGILAYTIFFSFSWLLPWTYSTTRIPPGKKGKGNLVQFGPLGRCVQWLGIAGEGP